MNSITKIILVNVIILAIGLAIVETIWSIYFANDNNINLSLNVLADTHYKYDVSNLYKSEKNIISYTRDKNGFRGDYSQVDAIDIIVVGGSTTDQRYIDDKEEWVYILAKSPILQNLNLTIVNAGVDGQSTFGHIKNFDLWFSKMDLLKPKFIMFYVGLNDFYKDANYLYDDLEKTTPTNTLKNKIKNTFSFYVYRLIEGITLAIVYDIGHEGLNFDSVKTTNTPNLKQQDYKPLMKPRLDSYKKRLKVLAEKTKELGATPVFITQRRMNHWIEQNKIIGVDKEHKYDNVYYNGVDTHHMEILLNKVTLSICNETSDTLCIDLASEIEFKLTDFYDVAHNTPTGAAKIGNYMAEKIKALY